LTELGIDERTDYAVSVRDGEPFSIPSLAQAEEAISLAEEVERLVLKQLGLTER